MISIFNVGEGSSSINETKMSKEICTSNFGNYSKFAYTA